MRLYDIATMAIMPSYFEGLPFAALEAMLAGKPIVATDTCGLRNVVIHRKTGLLVSFENAGTCESSKSTFARKINVRELANAQIQLLQNPELAVQMGTAGRKLALESFGRDGMAGGTMQVYTSVLAAKTTGVSLSKSPSRAGILDLLL